MGNIKLESARNIRDLGGIKTMDGRTVKPCRILRGDGISNMTPGDIDILTNQYKLKTVIDLRSPKEQCEQPDTPMPGVTLHLISIDDGPSGSIVKSTDQTEMKEETMAQKLAKAPKLIDQYARFVQSPGSVEQIKKIMHTIIDAREIDGSVLFHCFLGKDRTGLIAMLTLSLLGVSREDIVADYCATPFWYSKALKWFFKLLFKKGSYRAGKDFYDRFKADPSYIRHLYDTIINDYGSVEDFLRNQLDISDDLRDEFRNATLE